MPRGLIAIVVFMAISLSAGSACLAESSCPKQFRLNNSTWMEVFNDKQPKTSNRIQIISVKEGNVEGLFMRVSDDSKVEDRTPQLFNLNFEDSMLDLFFSRDPKTGRIKELMLRGDRYPIHGNFSLNYRSKGRSERSELIRMSYDQRHTPYLTIQRGECWLLGFLGSSQEPINLGEEGLTDIFRAAAYDDKKFLKEYNIDENRAVFLGDLKLAPSSSIGIRMESPKNECLHPGAVFIPGSTLAKIRKESDRGRRFDVLRRAIDKGHDPRLDSIVIRASEDKSIVLYNPEKADESFTLLNLISKKKKLCTFDRLLVDFK